MADKLDEMLGLAPTPSAAKTDGKTNASKKGKAAPTVVLPAYSPLRGVLLSATIASKIIGFEWIRIVADGNAVIIHGADGVDKTIFMKINTTTAEAHDLKFALGSLDELLPLLTDSDLPMTIETADVSVMNNSDEDDENSETITHIEKVPVWLTFGRAKHRLGKINFAPKAELKKMPVWDTTATLDVGSGSLNQFKSHSSRLKKTASWFYAKLEDAALIFVIGSSADSHAEISMGTCMQAKGVGKHAWRITTYLDVLKCIKELGVAQFNTALSADTGLMKISIASKTIFNEPIAFEIIIPGKIVD